VVRDKDTKPLARELRRPIYLLRIDEWEAARTALCRHVVETNAASLMDFRAAGDFAERLKDGFVHPEATCTHWFAETCARLIRSAVFLHLCCTMPMIGGGDRLSCTASQTSIPAGADPYKLFFWESFWGDGTRPAATGRR